MPNSAMNRTAARSWEYYCLLYSVFLKLMRGGMKAPVTGYSKNDSVNFLCKYSACEAYPKEGRQLLPASLDRRKPR
jgi:hypothetical protein